MTSKLSMQHLPHGFTLIEAIAVIAITGILAAAVALFIRAPVQGYIDSVRRADMTDIADTALRRIGRDIRLALPNSVRVSPDGRVIEFLQTKSGGRYRDDGPGNPLDFNVADSLFEALGPPANVAAGDEIVVYNLGIPGADAYAGNSTSAHNRRQVTAVAGNTITIDSLQRLPSASSGKRFHVVATPVTYVCAGSELRRYWGYPIQANQATDPNAPPLSAASNALLAGNATICNFSYDAWVVAQRAGLVTMRLAITEQNETVTLYHAAHVDNVP